MATAALAGLIAASCSTTGAGTRVSSTPTWSTGASTPRADDDSTLDAYVLDVGQGLCVYVDCPDNARPLLIDCGTDKLGRSTSRQITNWINSGADAAGSIALAVSHPHSDHYDILPGVRRSRVESVSAGGERSDYTNRRFFDWLGNPDEIRTLGVRSSEFRSAPLSCGTATVDVLSANASGHTSENGDSLVIAISLGSTTLILPGDAELGNETAAVAAARNAGGYPKPLTAVVSSHHGSDEEGSNDNEFFRFWRPDYLIFSSEPTYSHAHPRCSMIDRTERLIEQGAATPVRCGISEDVLETRTTRAQMLSTYDVGHIRVRLTRSTIEVACLVTSPACPTALNPADVPATRRRPVS
jgi:beta-lactamase superfamily II metal-dependent hydrolase